MVENSPLAFTDYYEGDIKQEDASYIPNILKNQSKNNIELIKIEDLRKSNFNLKLLISNFDNKKKQIIILDAVTEADLKEIVLNSQEIKYKFLFAGSAGLANHINLINNKKLSNKKVGFKKAEKLVIVAASRRNITNLQIEDVKTKFDVFELKINLDKILNNSSLLLKKDSNNIKNAIETYDELIIRPDPIFNSQDKINKLLTDYSIDFRDLQIEIKNYIGELIKNLFKDYSNIDLFLTGGDTAAGICKKLEVKNLNIIDELLTGIPLSLAKTVNYGDLNIITKAGGFGTEDSISEIIYKLRDRKKGYVINE
ncbi:nucleotide-binding domain containing protein [Halanaerobium congolense]|uniref:nucleotide-binding domain containing protein n=1 Tax=Halanaerobium congolense TaxID=54121 RepID=UPI00280BF38C|nr:nucleotide-binding domain containing protein [Halanaerobium congolense]